MKEQSVKAIELLGDNSIDCEIKNNGVHLIVTDFQGDKIDFYPTTGRFKPRDGLPSNGLNNLIRYVRNRIA